MATIGRLSEQQLQLFFLMQSMVLSYKPDGLARLTDDDVALASGALARSLETASKGVIFEETTGSVAAEGLRRALKPVIDEVTKNGGSRAEREVAVVLRGMERGARHEGGLHTDRRHLLPRARRPASSSNVRNRPRRPPKAAHRDAVIEFDVSRY